MLIACIISCLNLQRVSVGLFGSEGLSYPAMNGSDLDNAAGSMDEHVVNNCVFGRCAPRALNCTLT